MPRAFGECGLTMPEDWDTMMKELSAVAEDTAGLVTFNEVLTTFWSKKYNKEFTENRLAVQWNGRRSELYLDLKNEVGFPGFQYKPVYGMHFKMDRDVTDTDCSVFTETSRRIKQEFQLIEICFGGDEVAQIISIIINSDHVLSPNSSSRCKTSGTERKLPGQTGVIQKLV